MSTPTNIQIIHGNDGRPAFVVIPYEIYMRHPANSSETIPNAVMEKVIVGKMKPIRAWREHLGLTQTEMAERLDITQAAFAQFEATSARPRKSTLKRIAEAMGLTLDQVDF